jgi:hypothetical protein
MKAAITGTGMSDIGRNTGLPYSCFIWPMQPTALWPVPG